jgi:hypothetical protein
VPLTLHRPTRLPAREGRLQTLEATLRPTLVLPLQPVTVLPYIMLPLTVQPVTVLVVERPEPAYTRSHVAKLRQG